MSNPSPVETVSHTGNKIKIALAIIVLVAGVFAYSFFTDLNVYARLGVFVFSLALAVLLFAMSHTGKQALAFATGAYAEMKRVVWPTRKETIQLTGIVFAFVVVMGALLWLIDRLLAWLIFHLLLG